MVGRSPRDLMTAIKYQNANRIIPKTIINLFYSMKQHQHTFSTLQTQPKEEGEYVHVQ